MTTRTPEQIAAEIVAEHGGTGPAGYRNMVSAIEADRAQRAENTLTLTHGISGWDGTHAFMLDAMADVLDDGPVGASLTYWDEDASISKSVIGQWVAHNPSTGITFITSEGATLAVESEQIEELSI